MLDFLHNILPSGTARAACAVVSAIGATIGALLGWDETVEALLVFMAIDYLTGILAAYICPKRHLSSARDLRGICKKLLILLLVTVAHVLEQVTGIEAMHSLVVWFFIGNEGISILENAASAGVPIPKKLRDALEEMREK